MPKVTFHSTCIRQREEARISHWTLFLKEFVIHCIGINIQINDLSFSLEMTGSHLNSSLTHPFEFYVKIEI